MISAAASTAARTASTPNTQARRLRWRPRERLRAVTVMGVRDAGPAMGAQVPRASAKAAAADASWPQAAERTPWPQAAPDGAEFRAAAT